MEQTRNKKRKGFTLVELIVVIAIMLVLAVVAGIAITGLIQAANRAAARADAGAIVSALNNFNALVTNNAERVTTEAHVGTRASATGINLDVSRTGTNATHQPTGATLGILDMTYSITIAQARVTQLRATGTDADTGLHGFRIAPVGTAPYVSWRIEERIGDEWVAAT